MRGSDKRTVTFSFFGYPKVRDALKDGGSGGSRRFGIPTKNYPNYGQMDMLQGDDVIVLQSPGLLPYLMIQKVYFNNEVYNQHSVPSIVEHADMYSLKSSQSHAHLSTSSLESLK